MWAGERRGAARLASVGLAAVFIVLPAFALLGALATYQAGAAAKHANDLSDAFQQARYAVGSEESLERKYRLEPSQEVRDRHHAAAASLIAALQLALGLGAPTDIVMIDDALARHTKYLQSIDHMFAAIDAGDPARANQIDGAEVDPSFDAIETRVDAAAETHRAAALRDLNRLARIQTAVLIATPLVLALGMGLVVLFWRVLLRYRREADEAMTRESTSIRRSEERFRALVQNASDVVLICASDGIITYQSPTAESAWGFGGEGLQGRSLMELIHPDDQPALRELLEQSQAAPGTTRSTELRLHDASGAWRSIQFILTNLLREPSVEGYVATARDITERKLFEEQLTTQAFHDSLTGLPNRALLRDRLDQALARASRHQGTVAVLFIDLDNFKLVNDSLGHQVGDGLLVEAAKRLQECVRDENTVARLGGDEFVVLLDIVAGSADARLVAERIARQFVSPFTLDGRDFTVTASIGIALGGAGHEEQADNLLRNADVAMYRAKTGGKARHVVFDASMKGDALMRLELESDLRRAIEQGELRVYYQPIVVLDSGHVAEVEALVRWQHPVRGLVAPNDFIPIAEETGLIVPLGQWVLEEACRQTVAWQEQFPLEPPLMVSVNLSPRQFQQPALVDQVKLALSRTGLAPTSLKLEITEGVIMRDVEATITTLWQLKELGIKIAIDDFGTGYSSLAYLKRLPLDILKIDRSFINGIGKDQETTAIVRAIISLAKSLHLTVTGEGIETIEQSTLLRAWDCERGQGYLFARPLDAAGLTAMLGINDRSETVAQVA